MPDRMPCRPRQEPQSPLLRPVLAGAAAAAAGVIAWTLAAYATGYQLEFLAMPAGAAVGFAMTRTGSGQPPRLRVTGVLLALAACTAGTLAAMIAVLSGKYGISLGTIPGHLNAALRAYPGTVGWTGLLFWGMAVAGGAFPPVRMPLAPGRRRGPARGASQLRSPDLSCPGGSDGPRSSGAVSCLTARRQGLPPDLEPFLDRARGSGPETQDPRRRPQA